MLPRYFTPRTDPAPAPASRGPMLAHVLDAFVLAGREAVVAVDLSGALHVLTEGVPASLPAALREQLAHHEVVRGGLRRLDVRELWLFDLQGLEQPADAPGANDPVYLSGRLFGPHPEGPAISVEGRLTVTRADVLAGLVGDAGHAFRVGTGDGGACHHLVLPADRQDVVARGDGVVLAWPLIRAELRPEDARNEALAVELLYDVLAALQADLRAAGSDHPLATTTLPVPSRAELESELIAKGYELHGDEAIRRPDVTKKGLGGLLTAVFGVPDSMRLAMPAEGGLAEFLALAREALSAFPEWPDARAQALRRRVDPPPSAPQVQAAEVVAEKPRLPPRPSRWEDDFAETGPARPPRVSRIPHKTTRKSAPTPAPSRFPDWMTDFED